jgi:hypothetical protein
MAENFVVMCVLVVMGTLTVSILLAPVLWDASGYVNEIAACVADLAKCQ